MRTALQRKRLFAHGALMGWMCGRAPTSLKGWFLGSGGAWASVINVSDRCFSHRCQKYNGWWRRYHGRQLKSFYIVRCKRESEVAKTRAKLMGAIASSPGLSWGSKSPFCLVPGTPNRNRSIKIPVPPGPWKVWICKPMQTKEEFYPHLQCRSS